MRDLPNSTQLANERCASRIGDGALEDPPPASHVRSHASVGAARTRLLARESVANCQRHNTKNLRPLGGATRHLHASVVTNGCWESIR